MLRVMDVMTTLERLRLVSRQRLADCLHADQGEVEPLTQAAEHHGWVSWVGSSASGVGPADYYVELTDRGRAELGERVV